LDDCFINGKITPEAKEIVDRFHSYTERSPSGNGLKILIEADLRGGGRRKTPCCFFIAIPYSLRVFLFIRLLELLLGSKTFLQEIKKSVTSFLRYKRGPC
jgi:hypothetical protein